MKHKWVLPVFELGDKEGTGATFGIQLFSSVQDVYGFEPEAVDYLEVEGYWPKQDQEIVYSQEEYKNLQKNYEDELKIADEQINMLNEKLKILKHSLSYYENGNDPLIATYGLVNIEKMDECPVCKIPFSKCDC